MDSVINHTTSISKYNPLSRSSDIGLLKELDHPRKGLFNIQSIDNKSLVRYLNATDHLPLRITKADKNFANLGFNNIKFPVKIRDITQFKKIIPSLLVLFGVKKRKNI